MGTSVSSQTPAVYGNPFDLDEPSAYAAWREWKLTRRPATVADLIVSVADPRQLTADEHAALLARLRQANLALYQFDPAITGKDAIRALGRQFGLERLDGNLCADDDSITSLQVSSDGARGEYIPYTDRRLSWHTDGYYNPPDRQIRGIVMHCVRPAAEGGESTFLDHELAYILMRDASPGWIRALMAPDAMTIPANVSQGRVIRPAHTGPVFSLDPATGALHMRYSARTRNIVWKDDPDTRTAAAFLQELWRRDNPYVYHHRLVSGQGIICNNTLHNRSGFRDHPDPDRGRLLYRARYYDRVAGTALREVFPEA
ncbi:TauD/TfdA family dioxygenase [Thiohalobacter thiocyanaticus]|uniref:Taurine catabolism dioxygenase TauD n=1 Tax=Thiohalobacter thiocyanaticus TaxID=585455 RepID=A0A426QDX7_9GAMM|nr:TauD/TfdA family dioxygenase [Thiohalobacter thiocyanaticus]RRQ19941.1 taurine catabolism dioxygenase TauD [Thiohalobacter thiocyanaticus]